MRGSPLNNHKPSPNILNRINLHQIYKKKIKIKNSKDKPQIFLQTKSSSFWNFRDRRKESELVLEKIKKEREQFEAVMAAVISSSSLSTTLFPICNASTTTISSKPKLSVLPLPSNAAKFQTLLVKPSRFSFSTVSAAPEALETAADPPSFQVSFLFFFFSFCSLFFCEIDRDFC